MLSLFPSYQFRLNSSDPCPRQTNMTAATVTVVFLWLVFSSGAAANPFLGLDAFLTQQLHLDPSATNDSFFLLPRTLKKSLSTPSPLPQHDHDPNLRQGKENPISTLIASVLSLSIPVSIHVTLVGSASTFPSSSSDLISSFLSSSLTSEPFHVIAQPFHNLAISHSLHPTVSLASPTLVSRLSDSLHSALSSSVSSLRSLLTAVPFSVVDQIIQQEFAAKAPGQDGIFIYLISLGPQNRSYAYSYPPGEEIGDSSPARTKCLGNIWTGKHRYIWVDLNAGPVDYGPALSGEGVLPRGEFHPLSALHGGPRSQKLVMADLASLVWSAYKVLLVPPLRIPVHSDNKVLVEFIHIHSGGKIDPVGLNWDTIEKELNEAVAGPGGLVQRMRDVTFKNYRVNFDECTICSFAVARSLNSYTSRFLFENYTLIVNEYLDSKKLHHILSESAVEFGKAARVPDDDVEGNVLRVYVFDLDYNTLLMLDRYHQSVSFRDMVISVRTNTQQTVSDYSCNGQPVFTQSRELERSLVGSLLQSLWGVSPTHMLWSPVHNDTLIDYSWSIGQTPFGPFSESSSLSFVQKDSARRNVLLTSLNYSISGAIEILDSIKAHGGEKLFSKQKQREYVMRWNLFKYKLNKVVSAISHLQFDMAFYYLRSSDHDLYSLHSLVYVATQDLEASLDCFKDPPFPWGRMSLGAIAFCALVYLYANRKKLLKSKRKQF